MRNITRIIVHCTATPEGRHVTIADIDTWHRQAGYDRIGYHYVIYIDGTIHCGRDTEQIGAHCRGYNAASIGVCYVGGLLADGKTPADTRTPAQRTALTRLITDLRSRFPSAKVCGHRDLAPKACPCFDARAEYGHI